MNVTRISNFVFAVCIVAVFSTASRAAVIDLYTEDLDAFDAVQDLGDGVNPYGVQTVPEATSPFADGNAIQMIDFYDMDKPELQGELSGPLLEPFRIDFQSFNQSPASSSSAIRFRMSNSGQSITSEARSAFSLSWQADKRFTAKYNGSSDGTTTDIDTTNSVALEGVHDITMVANGALAGTYSYSLFGESRTLNPLSYDIYIDGVLFNASSPGDAKHDEFKNGMLFHDRPTDDYDPALGLQRFGLIGSSDANVDPDVLFDNIILRTGADIIPEPSSLFLLVAGSVWMWPHRRRQA